MEVLARAEWSRRSTDHASRVGVWVDPHLARRQAGVAHPVEDFLFTYYSYSPSALRRWHPGYGVVLAAYADPPPNGYVEVSDGITVADDVLRSREHVLREVDVLLRATAARPAHFGCLGLHEWAMVYREPQSEVRHSSWPLRLGPDGTAAVVDTHRVTCSHFDAYRFFSEPARSLNTIRPTSAERPAFEQPGCLHAGMDLYKHAYRLSPLVPSELVADCFELAHDIRVLDMRASPYDLSALGYSPVRIETPDGKQEYVAGQREFSERAAPLRSLLLDLCERLLSVSAQV